LNGTYARNTIATLSNKFLRPADGLQSVSEIVARNTDRLVIANLAKQFQSVRNDAEGKEERKREVLAKYQIFRERRACPPRLKVPVGKFQVTTEERDVADPDNFVQFRKAVVHLMDFA